MSAQLLSHYIRQLEEHAIQTRNDLRYISYVKYINAFLSVFGNERAYSVGSTAENLKLQTSKHGGDADFLLCSGRLEIPIDKLEVRLDFPCYVHIQADNLRRDVCGDLIDGYLCADILREVRPELFTILRAIYTEVTSTSDSIPGRQSRVTTTAVPMKVGLGRTEFRNLQIEGNNDILYARRSRKRIKLDRKPEAVANLRRRWRNVPVNESDRRVFQRIIKIIWMAREPGSKGEGHGQINEFADLLDSVMKRIPLEQEADAEEQAPDNDNPADDRNNAEPIPEEDSEQTIKASYTEMTEKDFVPALKITGNRKLDCMIAWKERVGKANWPPRNTVEEIFNTDIFVVAREAPYNPDKRKDFCLSFNLAELKLAQCLTKQQRRVYLVLKSYLSGHFKSRFDGLERKMRMKTYYLKHAFFWVLEREHPSTWAEDNTIEAVKTVLRFLLQCVREKRLSHYFVNSNLFAELEEVDYDILQHCIRKVLNDPIESISDYKFIQKDGKRFEIELSLEQATSLQELKEDGGREAHMDKLEDEFIDVHRGFNDGPRDVNGRAPIKEAVLKAFDVFLAEERQGNEGNRAASGSARGSANTAQQVLGGSLSQPAGIASLLNNIVTGGGTQSANSREARERLNILVGLGSCIPGGAEFIANIGGQEGVSRVLQQTANENMDHGTELRDCIDKYLSCDDDEEHACALELKQKVTAYFVGRKGI